LKKQPVISNKSNLIFEQEAELPTGMKSQIRRIFLFDEASLNSQTSSTESTSTFSNSSSQLPNHNNAGIYEDHPGLNPTDEAVVEKQCLIRERFEELTEDPERAQIMAEASHAESQNI